MKYKILLLIIIFIFNAFPFYSHSLVFFKNLFFLKTPVVQLLNVQSFAHDKTYKNLKLGGLSGLTFQKDFNVLYAISDDKKNHRIYKFKLIKNKNQYQIKLKSHILLHSINKKSLDFHLDPEDINLFNNSFFIASEGQQIFKTHDPPQIFKFNLKGQWLQSQKTAKLFWNPKKFTNHGAQENKGFESLIYNPKSNSLWTVTEMPLKQDFHIHKKTFLRISELQWPDGKILSQYPYLLKDASKGLTSLLLWKKKVFLALERSYDSNKKSNEVLLFLVNCKKASNLIKKNKPWKACSKKKIWSLHKEKSMKIQNANIEGMALGPRIAPNKRLLILVTDNNFIKKTETLFLFFAITVKK